MSPEMTDFHLIPAAAAAAAGTLRGFSSRRVFRHADSQYELSVLNYPVDALIRLADFYHSSVDYLLGLTDEAAPYPRRKT